MLNIKKLREQSEKARLEKLEERQAQNFALVGEVFTPCLVAEWEREIKNAAIDGKKYVFIRLDYDTKFNNRCYELIFELAEAHFKSQGFECASIVRKSRPFVNFHYLKIEW